MNLYSTSSLLTNLAIKAFLFSACLYVITPALKSLTTLHREDITVKAMMDKNSTVSRNLANSRSLTLNRLNEKSEYAKDKVIEAINKLPD